MKQGLRPKRRISWLAGQVPRAEDSTSTATGSVASRMSLASRSPTTLPANWTDTTEAIPRTWQSSRTSVLTDVAGADTAATTA